MFKNVGCQLGSEQRSEQKITERAIYEGSEYIFPWYVGQTINTTIVHTAVNRKTRPSQGRAVMTYS
jgi:hypothetical protein